MTDAGPDASGGDFEILHLGGNPTPEEEQAILDALEELVGRERRGVESVAAASPWKLAGRLDARRGGILDARTALGGASWAASAKLAWKGRSHTGRAGRGDSR